LDELLGELHRVQNRFRVDSLVDFPELVVGEEPVVFPFSLRDGVHRYDGLIGEVNPVLD